LPAIQSGRTGQGHDGGDLDPAARAGELAAEGVKQVAQLLWWTVLATATGARNGELCGLEWTDLDLDQGTVHFRQELTNVDADLLPGHDEACGRRKELAVGPAKSKASKAILSLPPFTVHALREHRRQQARLRLIRVQPATITLRWIRPGQPPRPVELDPVFRTERGTALTPTTPAAGSPTSPARSG
jgi:integrase